MANSLKDFQAEATKRGYTHDFALEAWSAAPDSVNEFWVVEFETFDIRTDPGDDVTMYLIVSAGGLKGYLILSDSFHADPRKAAFIDALLTQRCVGHRSP